MRSSSQKAPVDCELHHAILVARDVREAVEFYTERLGFWSPFMLGDPPDFAGVNLGQVQIFLERGTPNPEGCGVYFVVSNADALYEFHRSNGVAIVDRIDDRPYGLREYAARDLYGYRLTFGHRLSR